MWIAFGKNYIVVTEWPWSVFVYSGKKVQRNVGIYLKVLQVNEKRNSVETVVIVGDWSITSYLQWHRKSLWDSAEVVSPQSEVGKLNEGSKGQGIHIPLTQQISLQFKGNEAAQTFDRKKCALHHCLSPEIFRAKTAVHYHLRAFNLHPFAHMNHHHHHHLLGLVLQ